MTTSLSFEQIRAEFDIVKREVPVRGQANMPLVYLDHAASTHAPRSVIQRYCKFLSEEYANVHRGTYMLSRKATELFDESYTVIADFIGGNLKDDCVVFTTNTTEAIDLAAYVMAQTKGDVVITEMEHHSNDLPYRRCGNVLRTQVKSDGSLDLNHLEQLLKNNHVKLVAMTGASNITGVINDIHAAARLAHAHGALILVDAAQLLAHYPLDVRPFGHPEHIDFLAAAGHKAYAPFGTAFLYGPRKVMDAVKPYRPGGGTASAVSIDDVVFVDAPDRHQGGTPNIGGVIAMAESLKFLKNIGMQRIREHELELTRAAIEGFAKFPEVTLYGPSDAEKRLGVLSFNVQGISDLLAAAVLSEEKALACRNGRFCSHIYMDKLIQTQGGATSEGATPKGAVRASFGLYNDLSDVARLLEGVKMLVEKSWIGTYQVKSPETPAESASRCNDQWMESSELK